MKALNWARETNTGDPAKKAVLLILADLADENHSCFPSIEYISEHSEVKKRTLITLLNGFEEAGLIRRVRRDNGFGKRLSNRYLLAVDAPFEVNKPSLGAKFAPSDEPNKTPDEKQGANSALSVSSSTSQGANCCTYKETPEKIDKSIFIESEPSAEVATPPEEHYSTTSIDVRLRKIHPSLSVPAIAARLKVADIADVDVLRATQTLLSRATRTVHNPVAFVATGIDRSPEVWRPMLPGFEPGQDVSGTITAREQRVSRQRAQAAACESGDHDWGPTVWAEVDRAYCLPCGTSRRSVDRVFREMQDEHDRYMNGGGESDGASA